MLLFESFNSAYAITGGRHQANHRRENANQFHPEGMQKPRFWHPFQGTVTAFDARARHVRTVDCFVDICIAGTSNKQSAGFNINDHSLFALFEGDMLSVGLGVAISESNAPLVCRES
jgi:hypothetical protein